MILFTESDIYKNKMPSKKRKSTPPESSSVARPLKRLGDPNGKIKYCTVLGGGWMERALIVLLIIFQKYPPSSFPSRYHLELNYLISNFLQF